MRRSANFLLIFCCCFCFVRIARVTLIWMIQWEMHFFVFYLLELDIADLQPIHISHWPLRRSFVWLVNLSKRSLMVRAPEQRDRKNHVLTSCSCFALVFVCTGISCAFERISLKWSEKERYGMKTSLFGLNYLALAFWIYGIDEHRFSLNERKQHNNNK